MNRFAMTTHGNQGRPQRSRPERRGGRRCSIRGRVDLGGGLGSSGSRGGGRFFYRRRPVVPFGTGLLFSLIVAVFFDIALVIIGRTGPIALTVSGEAMFDDNRDIFINRAGVSLFFLDA